MEQVGRSDLEEAGATLREVSVKGSTAERGDSWKSDQVVEESCEGFAGGERGTEIGVISASFVVSECCGVI